MLFLSDDPISWCNGVNSVNQILVSKFRWQQCCREISALNPRTTFTPPPPRSSYLTSVWHKLWPARYTSQNPSCMCGVQRWACVIRGPRTQLDNRKLLCTRPLICYLDNEQNFRLSTRVRDAGVRFNREVAHLRKLRVKMEEKKYSGICEAQGIVAWRRKKKKLRKAELRCAE